MDAYVAVTNQPSPKTPLGTIILHNGNTGTTFFSSGGYNASGLGTSYVSQYWSDQFETVQVAWADSWWDNSSDPPVKSVLQEACRPATLLSWINSHYLQSASKPVCAQGHSAGAAAIAYPLAWYGADRNTPGGYLDTVLFTSGPTLSDIKAGCQYPQATGPQNVCSGGVCVGGAAQWPDCQQYMNGNMDCNTVPNLYPPGTVNAAKGVDRMTIGLSNQYASETCNNYNQDPNDNTKDLNAVWANMSLVQPTGLGNNYNYPHTSVSAFLCSGPDLGPQSPPAPGTSGYINYSNNSALQAWDYLSIVHGSTLQNGGTPYIYRVDSCTDPEQIWTSAAFATTTIGLQPGYIASYQAMETNCSVPH